MKEIEDGPEKEEDITSIRKRLLLLKNKRGGHYILAPLERKPTASTEVKATAPPVYRLDSLVTPSLSQ